MNESDGSFLLLLHILLRFAGGLHTKRPHGVGCCQSGHLSDLRFGVIDNEMKTMFQSFPYNFVSFGTLLGEQSFHPFFIYGHYNAMTAVIKAARSPVKCLGRLMTGCQPYKNHGR